MKQIIESWIDEDIGFGDITTEALIPKNTIANAKIIAKEPGTVAGTEIAKYIFESSGLRVAILQKDGSQVYANGTIMKIKGNAREILSLERTALNILMRMSGIATETFNVSASAKAVNPFVKIAGTRKTAPGLAKFDNAAIAIGGGETHRFSLDDMVLIKDNHITAVGGIIKAIEIAKKRVSFTKKIEIEVENSKDAALASKSGADIIMLDNMSPKEIEDTIDILIDFGLRDNLLIEVSGGINSENIIDYAQTGADILSLGYLTHSVKALDIGLTLSLE
ncbi:MAG: carboxylating nicotinate-nucleotide diphosphorylase [Methanobrevibacter sp.]|nr:carboxylating nicotinate-nucleotide diphosphorylase [Methanobrevibacter sp.]